MSYDNVLSLGADCYTRIFLDSYFSKKETQLFDYIGSSMWGINDMLESNFEGLTDASYYSIRKVINDKPAMPVHERYNLRFLHDGTVIRGGVLDGDFVNKMQRRSIRFKEILLASRNPLFVRVQDKQGRLWDPKEYSSDEMAELLRFRAILKDKYGVINTTIIYINRDYDGIVNGIHCIKTNRKCGPIDSIRNSFKLALSAAKKLTPARPAKPPGH